MQCLKSQSGCCKAIGVTVQWIVWFRDKSYGWEDEEAYSGV